MTPTFSSPPPEGCITVDTAGPVLLIGLNRPAKRNGVTPTMLRELAQAYTRLDDDPQLRVAVLHAAGNHFTGGIDLPAMAEFHQRGEKPVPRDAGLVDPLDLDLPGYRRRSKPVVVAVQGICFTIGIELMLAADIVVAADNGRFAQMEVGRGIIAASGATMRMAERAGMGNAMRLLLTGMDFDSAEALRLNFVQEVVPVGQCFARAFALAERIAAQAPQAVVATRLNVRKSVVDGMPAAVAELLAVQQRLAKTEDAAEGRRSFVEKRPPVFTGR